MPSKPWRSRDFGLGATRPCISGAHLWSCRGQVESGIAGDRWNDMWGGFLKCCQPKIHLVLHKCLWNVLHSDGRHDWCPSLCSSDGSTFRLFTVVGCSHVTVHNHSVHVWSQSFNQIAWGKSRLASAVVTGKYACNLQCSQDRFTTS